MTRIEKIALGKLELWKVAVRVGLSLIGWSACALFMPGCASLTPAQRNTLLERNADMICVWLNIALPDAPAIAEACKLEPYLIPELEKLIASKAAAARIAAAKR